MLLGQNMITCTHYEHDFDALRAALDPHRRRRRRRVRGQLAHRGGGPSPSASGTTPVVFPSDHGGFLGGEYGQTGEPEAFAAKLREVL